MLLMDISIVNESLFDVKLMRFGYDLFSPAIPPPATLSDSTTMNTIAINPQDIILTSSKDTSIIPASNDSHWFQLSLQQKTSLLKCSSTIGGLNVETVRSPYSNLDDKFFSTTTHDGLLPNPIPFDEGSFNHYGMLPSSAISQSEIIFDENPLGFFDENSAPVEHHFNSGITSTSASFCEPIVQQRKTSNDLFLNNYEEEDASSVETNSVSLPEQGEGFSTLAASQTAETRLIKLITELNDLIQAQVSFTKYNNTFRKIRKEYKKEIQCAFDNDNNIYHTEIRRLRGMAHEKLKTKESSRRSKKRKRQAEEENPINDSNRKTRKNYQVDTIDLLMDWFLVNHGKAPSNQCKKELAEKTAKSIVQSK
jgi:hypothetical protein